MKLTKSLCICLVFLCVHAIVDAINFSPALDINNDPAKSATTPQISLNSTGTAIAVWSELIGLKSNIFARTFDGTNWSETADSLNTNTSRDTYAPQIALNDDGTAIAVWQEYTGSAYNIFARTFNGTSWSETTSLNNNTSRDATLPQIALNSTGTAIAVWREYSGVVVRNIFARTFDGTSWAATADNLNTDTSRGAEAAQIALNSTGTAIAVWYESNNIFARTFNGTSWSETADNLNTNTSRPAYYPQVALNSTGTAIAVWHEFTGSAYNIFARTFNGTSWSETATNLNNNNSNPASLPHIALKDDGTAIAVWLENVGGADNIFARTFDGTNWSTADNLNYNTTSIASGPQIALNDDGTAIAMWVERTGSAYHVFARTFDGTNWSLNAVNLNNNISTFFVYDDISISLNNNGTAIAVWVERFGSAYHVFARHTVLPYYFTQWLSAWDGNKQYIAAATYNEKLNKNCVDIYEFLPNNNGIDFKTSITFESTTTINSFAVYNKSDAELYLAIVGSELLHIWKFDGTSTALEKDLSQAGHTYNDAQWWVSESNDEYIAAIDNTDLTVFDLSNSTTCVIAASGNKLLWIAKDSYRGVAVVDTYSVTPYQVDYSSTITITAGTGYNAPEGFEFESISTCGDYIAVGLTSTDTTAYGYAQIHLLGLNNNMLTFSGTSTTLIGQIAVPSLARCCCCSTLRPLLAGSYDNNRNYSISVFAPDLTELYASTLLGNNVNSVGWSCQDESIYLTAAGHENINDFLYTVKYTFSVDGNTLIEPVVLNK